MVAVLLTLTGWAWFLLAFPFILLAFVTHYDEDDNFAGSPVPFLIVIATLAFLTAFTNINPFLIAWADLWTAGFYVGIYFVAGTVYSFPKWMFYVLNRRDHYESRRSAIQGEHAGYVKDRGEGAEDFKTWMLRYYNFPPTASRNKARIYYWIMYWPASLSFTIFNDPLRRIFNFLYNIVGKTFDRISANLFANKFEEFK